MLLKKRIAPLFLASAMLATTPAMGQNDTALQKDTALIEEGHQLLQIYSNSPDIDFLKSSTKRVGLYQRDSSLRAYFDAMNDIAQGRYNKANNPIDDAYLTFPKKLIVLCALFHTYQTTQRTSRAFHIGQIAKGYFNQIARTIPGRVDTRNCGAIYRKFAR